ncbi:DNA sulfur modification protein DndD [Pseudoalteromonas sp. S558]|uniref:DNA sulfur modification protein DndD n=1 Tax=Pseudoalteromonas sp. S558 TaxID=2066515 RepID=UPI00110BF259|nr:DNA sulfur modification protein DndD [Pseudoalteromonas sp. S558]TMO03066.1 DNA sulfur modification protein DndD [Pseudoalteromonas sp. S558]
MIITKLSLNNFRVFAGKHEIDLRPEKDKPIILFGGLNGAGKTSILTAIRFVLLGRQAFSDSLSNPAFINELQKLINNSDGKTDNKRASLELEFNYVRQGICYNYCVKRHWQYGSIDELVIVENDIEKFELNYEQAQAFLLELIPTGIADLVFFDGEKIAELAEDNSGAILQHAVKRLLGLDIVTRLKEDLRIYLRKAGIAASEEKLKEQYHALESEKDELLAQALLKRSQADLVFNSITELNLKITSAEQDLLSGGGAWASSREATIKSTDINIQNKAVLESRLQQELEGDYALSLAQNTLSALLNEIAKTHGAAKKIAFKNQLNSFLEQHNSKQFFDYKDQLLSAASEYSKPEDNLTTFDLSEQQSALLHAQVTQRALSSLKNANALKLELVELQNIIENASINIARAPEQEQLQQSFDKLRILEKEKNIFVKDYKNILLEAKTLFKSAQDLTSKLVKLQKEMKTAFGEEDSAIRASRTITLLDEFATELAKLKLTEIETKFIKSYKELNRKEDLKIDISIDPQSYNVILLDNFGNNIDKNGLSAGEKQIFAIAMLDALAAISGKKLPVVIDTPLGRLDSNHRDKLVQHYFPKASEQVIILSTDTEINEQYIKQMKDSISRKYDISFDQITKTSSVTTGYFWDEDKVGVV